PRTSWGSGSPATPGPRRRSRETHTRSAERWTGRAPRREPAERWVGRAAPPEPAARRRHPLFRPQTLVVLAVVLGLLAWGGNRFVADPRADGDGSLAAGVAADPESTVVVAVASPTVSPNPPRKPTLGGVTPPTPTPSPTIAPTAAAEMAPTPRPDT